MPNSMSSVSREIATLRRTLKAMDRSLHGLAPQLRAAGNGRANGKAERPVRKLRLSPKRRAQLKLQGQYMGHLKGLRHFLPDAFLKSMPSWPSLHLAARNSGNTLFGRADSGVFFCLSPSE